MSSFYKFYLAKIHFGGLIMEMPMPWMPLPISTICTHREWFYINPEYQREPNIWTREDEQYLIDSILKGFDIPKIYLRKVGEKKYEIVDGQQRILTIWKFRDNKLPLNGKISGDHLDGLYYKDLPEDLVRRFDNFPLHCMILEDYDDDKVRELFSRLQRGKPLNPAEKLNAFPGSIVPLMRKIGKHKFFNKVAFSLSRYRTYHLAAIFLLLESEGFSDISPKNLYDFFKKNRNLNENSRVAIKINRVLNYLDKVFPEKTPEISKNSWLVNLYLLISDLMDKYVLKGREKEVRNFYLNFWREVEDVGRTGKGSSELIRFYDANKSGTTSKKNIETRFKIMKTKFLEMHRDLELLDPNRYFDYYEKVVIYRRDKGICQECGRKVAWEEFEADHIKAHSSGGKTTIENGQLLCRECNRKKGSR